MLNSLHHLRNIISIFLHCRGCYLYCNSFQVESECCLYEMCSSVANFDINLKLGAVCNANTDNGAGVCHISIRTQTLLYNYDAIH